MDAVILASPVPIAAGIFQSDEAVIAHDSDGAYGLTADDVDGDDAEIPGLVLIEDSLQARKLRTAPLSTWEPEIDQNDLAVEIGELEFLVGNVLL